MSRKTVILGVTGCIAAYKACEIISSLKKLDYDIKVIMTANATEFITPLTLETLSQAKVVVDMFDKNRGYEVEHISYAKLADVFVIAPATANIIAKIADGIADDMLTTTFLASKAPKIICPAMNTNMYDNKITEQNIAKLKSLGYIFIEPEEGRLACGDVGRGKLADVNVIVKTIDQVLTPNPDLRDKTILITAGATEEPIDSVRFITNRSSGKMGVALANNAIARGAKVILVVGKMTVASPKGATVININTTKEMYDAVMANLEFADIIIKAAAPSDYKVSNFTTEKHKEPNLTLQLEKNIDIAAAVGRIKGTKKLVVFAAETNDLLTNAVKKLASKNADLMIANDVTLAGAGFDVDTNIATIIYPNGKMIALPQMSKIDLANIILDKILS